MQEDVVILAAEDDPGHFSLVKRNLSRAGISNEIVHFKDGQEILDYLFMRNDDQSENIQSGKSYIMLLDIRMPKIDGIEVLKQAKQDPELRKIPVTMLTTTDDPIDIHQCHQLGCSAYVVKPIDYDKFASAIEKMGSFFSIIKVPDVVN